MCDFFSSYMQVQASFLSDDFNLPIQHLTYKPSLQCPSYARALLGKFTLLTSSVPISTLSPTSNVLV